MNARPPAGAASEGRDDRRQGQDLVAPAGPVRQIRARAGRARGLRAGGQRRDGDLDLLPRHQDHAHRRHGREGGSHRPADRAVDRRAGAADQLGDPRQRPDAGPAQCRLRPAAQPGAAGQPAHAARRRRPRAAEDVAQRAPRGRQQGGFFPRYPLHRDRHPRRQLFAGRIPRRAALRCRSRCRIPASMPASPSPISIFPSSPISSATPRSARPPPPMWSIRAARCWRVRPTGPELAKDLSKLPQVEVAAEERRRAGVGQGCATAIRC